MIINNAIRTNCKTTAKINPSLDPRLTPFEHGVHQQIMLTTGAKKNESK